MCLASHSYVVDEALTQMVYTCMITKPIKLSSPVMPQHQQLPRALPEKIFY